MGLDHAQPAAHLIADVGGGRADMGAGGGEGVPFHIKHRGQHAACLGHVADEPAGLILGRGAEIVEMIGAAFHGGLARALPVAVEVDVFEVAAFGGLDEGEVHSGAAGGVPVDIVLETGHVDAVHGVGGGGAAFETHRVAVAEGGGKEHAGRGRGRAVGVAAGGEGEEREDQRAAEDHGLGFLAMKARLLAGMSTSSIGLRAASLSQRAISVLSL